jgi:hypothetical protein
MITKTLAKVRERFNLPPGASLSQIDAAMDAEATTPEATGEGEDTPPEAVETPAVADSNVEGSLTALTREDVQAMITDTTAVQAQAIVDLNSANEALVEANATLSARLAVVESADAAEHTGGKPDPVVIVKKPRAYHSNPMNQ